MMRGVARLVLDTALIRAHAGDLYFARGLAYHRQGAVSGLRVEGAAATAIVSGSRRYWVRVELTGDGLAAECSCPLGVDGVFCKHVVATALAWLDRGEPEAAPVTSAARASAPRASAARASAATPDLTAFLRAQPVDWLVEQLLAATEADPLLRAGWAALAAEAETRGPSLAGFRAQLDHALLVPDYLDWDETSGYVDSACHAIASIEELLENGLAVAAVELTEHALRLLEAAVEAVDQNGEMTGVLESAQELHLEACLDARPEPVALAERLTRWAISSEWGVFSTAIQDYADLYGEAGMKRCRQVVEEEWATLPPLRPGESGGSDTNRATLSRLRLSFANTPDERVEVLARDLSTPAQYVTIAGELSSAGRFDDALRWLTEARAAFPQRSDTRVDAAVADTLRLAGRAAEAIDAEWECYHRRPGLASFQRFAQKLRPLDDWPRWRAQALAVLERPAAPGSWPQHPFASEHGNSRLVDVLLWDGDVDEAWAAAQRGGCDAQGWLRLARARVAAHPGESIPVLVRVIDAARASARHRKDYAAVAAHVAELRTWHRRAGTDSDFAAYLRRLRAAHRNRPAFQDELGKAGLP
jgi:uncharacterized Zn finger protein